MRLIVTGSRNWTDYPVLAAALHEVSYPRDTPHTLVHGGCPDGADFLADHFAREMGWAVEEYPADWSGPAGLGAGYARNLRMVQTGADVVVGFVSQCTKPRSSRCWSKSGTHASHGTVDCLRKALDYGIPVRTWTDMPPARR